MLYSSWLKLWGAKIGKNIYWSSQVTIIDRPFLEVGDGVVFGYGVKLSSHYVNMVNKESLLVLANIEIGDHAVLGGISGMSTGAKLGRGEILPGRKILLPFQQIINGKTSFREDSQRKP